METHTSEKPPSKPSGDLEIERPETDLDSYYGKKPTRRKPARKRKVKK